VLVTGSTAGIGFAIARSLASEGVHVYLNGRTQERVDTAVADNVGIFEPKPFADISDADWYRFFEVNVMSGVRLARHYLAGMLKKNWGRIVFISSESAVQIPPEMVHQRSESTILASVRADAIWVVVGSYSRRQSRMLKDASQWVRILNGISRELIAKRFWKDDHSPNG
jgi:NAD(P)-dependent dehydrogenase (short-subunit alcohol dehydrogenase family)